MYRKILVLSLCVLISLFSSCTKEALENIEIVIAEQYGLAYAPLQLLKVQAALDDAPGGVRISWVRTANATAIREAMLAKRMDIGFMGLPPFLIGADKGMGWKLFTGLSRSPLGLVSADPELLNLKDFSQNHRIALPQPGSIQHILLSMAAKRILGNPKALDGLLVTMNHPDGMSALLSKTEISAHFTAPPYLMMELADPANKLILTGEEAFGGPFTFIAGAVSDASLPKLKNFLPYFIQKLDEACVYIHDHTLQAAQILAPYYELSIEETAIYLSAEGTRYETEIHGLEGFIDFMHENGYLSEAIDTKTLVWKP